MKDRSVSIYEAVQNKINVMHAVMLRDIRSRYFNHGLGFLIGPLFPVGHVLILLTIYKVTGRQAIFGDDLILFFATGLLPVLSFTYISRFMAISLQANKGMMAFPAVHLLDIVLARALLEFVGIVIAFFMMFIMLISVGSDPFPFSSANLLLPIFLMIALSIGMGIIASVISAILPAFMMIYSLSMAVVYVSSGGPIFLQMYPDQFVRLCAINPLFHVVEWVRSAYYMGYPQQYLDKQYLTLCALGSLCIGLIMERWLRPVMLSSG